MQLTPRPDLAKADIHEYTEFVLDRQDIEYVRFLLWSDAWQKFFEPLMDSIEASLDAELRDPSIERKHRLSDDAIRGGLRLLETLRSFPRQIIEEADNDAAEEQRLVQEQERLVYRGQVGFTNPHGPTPGDM